MAIPEHDKCVALHKLLRRNHQKCNWRRFRAMRRRKGEIKLKIRIRQMLRIEFAMERSRIIKKYNSYTAFNKLMRGRHYRRWGKYDD